MGLASETVQVVERAIDVLFCFATDGGDLGVAEIARQLGVSKGAVHRLLTALKNKALVVEDPRSRRYALGVRVLELSGALLSRLDVRERARGHLQRLRDLTGETAGLAVRAGSHRFYVEQVESRHELRQTLDFGEPVPLHAGAASKAILANLEPAVVDEILGGGALRPLTESTLTDRQRLHDELECVRRRGFAVSSGERLVESRSIAAPVFSNSGEVFALNVSGPCSRFSEPVALGWAPRLLESALALSRELGYPLG
jgi:DNA-binding IclR family transcriptional regulator